MADSKKFWRETIGTGVAPRPVKPAPRPGGPAPPAGRPAAPAFVTDEEDAPRAPSRRPAIAPGTIAVGSLYAETPAPMGRAKSAAMEALELVLEALPVGSITLAEQVGARLWPDPAPAEVRDLARLLVARNQVPDLTMRDALIRSIAVRQRSRRLRRTGPDVPLDATAFATRAHEWSRLAEVAGEIGFVLQSAPDARGADAIAAALALLPDPLELAAEADVARTAAGLIEVARGEAARSPHQEQPPVDDAISLLGAIKEDRPRPGDPLLLEIWAACSLVRRDLPQADRAALEHDRRVLAVVDARAEEAITLAVRTEGADREAARRLLAWRRYLAEMIDRVRARLDPPKPAVPVPATVPPSAASSPAGPAAAAAEEQPGGEAKEQQGLIFRATSRLMGLLGR
jgi:hypothetical protein